jgi:MFS family permease
MINKNIIALGFVSFFTDMASSMVTTILPLYIVYVLNEGVDKLGFVVAIATFVSYGFRLVFGYLSDRWHIVKPFVVAGYLISAVSKPMLGFANTWQSIATLRGAERMGKAIRSATKDTLISAYSEKKSGKSFGFHKMMDVAGEMSGAIVAFLALLLFGRDEEIFKDIFLWTLIPGIFSVLIVIFFVKDVPYEGRKKESFKIGADRRVLPVLMIFFIFSFFLFNDSFFIIKAKNSGIDMAYIPLFVVLLYFVQTISSYFFGLMIDRFDIFRVLMFSMTMGVVATVLLYFNLIIGSFTALGLFSVSSLNAIRSYISDNAQNRGTVYGIFYAGIALFGALGSMVAGLIWREFGEDIAISFSMAGLVVVFLIFVIYSFKFKGIEQS